MNWISLLVYGVIIVTQMTIIGRAKTSVNGCLLDQLRSIKNYMYVG